MLLCRQQAVTKLFLHANYAGLAHCISPAMYRGIVVCILLTPDCCHESNIPRNRLISANRHRCWTAARCAQVPDTGYILQLWPCGAAQNPGP